MESINELRELEERLLFLDPKQEGDLPSLWHDVITGRYLKVLESDTANKIFPSFCVSSSSALNEYFSDAVEQYLSQGPTERQWDVFVVGVACLQAFIQANWTGPPILEADALNNYPWLNGVNKIITREDVCSYLALDAECVAPCVVLPHLLLVARVTLHLNTWRLSDLKSSSWWSMRYLFVHQQVLEEKSPQVYNALKKALSEHPCQEIVSENPSNCKLRALFNIECANIYVYYFEVLKSNECLQIASEALGLEVSLTGALGKRTKFQERDISQLTLNVKLSSCEGSSLNDEETHLCGQDLPKDLQLQDEVRLNQIKFLNTEEGQIPDLKPLDQALIFGFFVLSMKSQPKDKLADEELLAYVSCLLSQPRVWCLQLTALLERCRLESHNSRTVERSMMQAQVLVDSINSINPEAQIRHKYFYCCRMPPSWKVETDLAHLFLSLGAVNSALEIFLRLQLWEEVIVCYTILELKHKAVEIIEQQLAVKETPKLWCLLGDSKGDVSCYEKAWELSGRRSARAQRHWGLYYYFKGKHAEAIPFMQKSLEINSLQEILWSRLGFSALSVEDWELAASSYRRYCALDTENFEAWNNLAKAYVKLGQKARAWKALQEAVKCNYENWKVWDNLMVVSTDCGEFEEVIKSYHRILDLKEKHIDTEVLQILVGAIVKNEPDNLGVPSGRLKEKALALFGRLTSQVMNNAMLWILYAKLVSGTSDPSPESSTKVAQFLLKGHRSAVQAQHWERDVKSCVEVLTISESLADAYMKCVQNCQSNQIVQMLSSAKLAIKGVVTKVKQYHVNSVTQEVISTEILPVLTKVEEKLEQLMSEISRQQASS